MLCLKFAFYRCICVCQIDILGIFRTGFWNVENAKSKVYYRLKYDVNGQSSSYQQPFFLTKSLGTANRVTILNTKLLFSKSRIGKDT